MASDPHKENTTRPGYSTTNELAAKYGVKPGRMRSILSEAKLGPEDRQTGRGGQHIYKDAAVAKVMKNRPGQGAGGGPKPK